MSINGFNTLTWWVPECSVLGLPFVIFLINAIKLCQTHHFTDDNNLLHTNDTHICYIDQIWFEKIYKISKMSTNLY